jgi:ABC-2 type transport system permease protein
MSSQGMRQDERLIEELRKQYDVVQVDATNPITERYDALLAVQPSSLNPNQMANFVAAVQSGQPTAIFEDPFPTDGNVPATSQPKRPAGGMQAMFGGMQPPEPKGDIRQLWDLLGVEFTGDRVIWQEYNPYPMFQFVDEIVFVGDGSGAPEPFSPESEISKGLQQVVLLFPGSVRQRNASTLEFTPLMTTSDKSGMIEYDDIMEQQMLASRMRSEMDLKIAHRPTRERYILAAHIHGKMAGENLPMSDEGSPLLAQAPADLSKKDDGPADDKAKDDKGKDAKDAKDDKSADASKEKSDSQAAELNVVLVTDIDFIGSQFFEIRSRGSDPDAPVNMQFDNVTFVLNTLDKLAADERFIDIRKRRPAHRTLTRIEDATAEARASATAAVSEAVKASNEAKNKAQAEFNQRIAEAEKKTGGVMEKLQEVQIIRNTYQRRLDAENERLQRELERKIQQIERGLDRQVRQVQDRFKLLAVSIPPILPLLMGVLVFFNRRAREREGVSKSRLR